MANGNHGNPKMMGGKPAADAQTQAPQVTH